MFDDKNLIEGCRKNKHKFQMALFDKYAPMLRGVCMRYTNSEFDADDLLQEGFIKILSNIKKYVDCGSFVGWMKKIMINHAINYCRKKNKTKFFELNEEINNVLLTDDDNISNKTEDRVIEADIKPEQILNLVNELPEGYKMVMNMYVIDGFTHKEIAEKLNISINTSKSQLSRARKLLLAKTNELIIKNNKLQYE